MPRSRRRLCERRRTQLPHRNVEVINAGVPGEIMSGSAQDFQDFGGAFKPHMVVVYHGPNDLRRALSGQGASIAPGRQTCCFC